MNKKRPRLEEDSITVRAVIDSMGEGLITIDAEGIITAVNPYALHALGYQEDELLGQWFTGAVTAVDEHGRPLDRLSRPVARALTSGEAVAEQTYYLRKDGSRMPVFLTVSPILLEGRPVGAIELFRDITADKQLDIAKEDFVSLASHQLRTPASGVQAILSMVLAEDFGTLTPVQHRQISRALQANRRQLQIIEDLLNTARIDSGKMELQLSDTNLAQLVADTLSDYSAIFADRHQEVSFNAVGQPVVYADGGKIRMVLDNLVSNASKYTPKGGRITVHVDHCDEGARIAVCDTGVGIASDDLPRLFTKFARFDNEFSTLVGGSGLGLYLANNIVGLHQGRLTVESQVGVGSKFCVTLPTKLG